MNEYNLNVDVHSLKLAKNTFYTFINSALILFTGIIVSIVTARFLGPARFGIYQLILWIMGAAAVVYKFGMSPAITKYVAEYEGREKKEAIGEITGFAFVVQLVVSLACAILLISFSKEIALFFGSEKTWIYILIVAAWIVPSALTGVLVAAIKGLQLFQYFIFANIIVLPISTLAIFLVLKMDFGIEGVLVTQASFQVFYLLVYYFLIRKRIIFRPSFRLEPTLRKRFFNYSLSMVVILFLEAIIWQRSEIFFLGKFSSAEQIAFYALAFGISMGAIGVLTGNFMRVLMPTFSSIYGAGDMARVRQLFTTSTRYIGMLVLPVCTAGIVVAPLLIKFLYGQAYLFGSNVLRILLVSSALVCISTAGAAVMYGTEKQNMIVKFWSIVAAVNIALDLLLIPRWGSIGAALANSSAQILGVILGGLYLVRAMKAKYPLATLFKVLLASTAMAVVLAPILWFSPQPFGLISVIIVALPVYYVFLLLLKAINATDIAFFKKIVEKLPNFIQPVVVGIVNLSEKQIRRLV